MFQLMDRVRGGVDPMIANLESYIVTTGLDDMKASADTITSVSPCTSVKCVFTGNRTILSTNCDRFE